MKRFITVLSSLLVLPAFAEVAPAYYDDVIEYNDEMIDDEEIVVEETQAPAKSTQKQNIINRSTSASRAVSSATTSGSTRSNASSRAVATSPRSTTGTTRATVSRTAKTNTVVSRAPTTTTRTSVTSRNTRGTKPVTARVGTNNNSVMTGNRSLTNVSQSTLNDSGATLYNANTARIGIANRRTTARISTNLGTNTTPVVTEEDISETTKNLTAIAELTDYCKAQYAACMDNYCNVLDDNQGRCSCSKNIKNYAKTEAALAQATEKYQEAIQKIKYIGLTTQQIEALFTETEAELSMKNASDNSRLKTSLDSIKKSVVDISTPSASSFESTSGISLNTTGLLDADFTSGFDLNSFLGGMSGNTSTVSNQRGEQLYKTATNRCKTAVLNSCVSQGIDANVITNAYDLEIDKHCVAYERSLNEANTEMRSNISNATTILQQARLMLTQNKNSYDFRGCVAAIDACMQDEYVCGQDYELCLDPSGKYLANGEIVKGGAPGVSGGQNVNKEELTDSTMNTWLSNGMYSLYATWNYKDGNNDKNAWGAGKEEDLGGYIDVALTDWEKNYTNEKNNTTNMATYLLQKIGYIDTKDNDKVHGMCASVMKQCQNYTFDSQKTSKKYLPSNEVVRQYLVSTLAKIKVKQDAILADYAEGCRADVQSCLSTNGYDESNTASTLSKTAINACSSEITTCMSVGGYQVKDGVKLTLRAMTDWVSNITVSCAPDTYYYYNENTQTPSCKPCPEATLLVQTGIEKNRESGTYGAIDSATDWKGFGSSPTATHSGGVSDSVLDLLYNQESSKVISIQTTKDANGNLKKGFGHFNKQSMTSNGGQVESCSCPEGYDYNYVVFHTTDKDYHYCLKKGF